MDKLKCPINWLEIQIKHQITNSSKLEPLFKKARELQRERLIDFADDYVDNCVIPNENMAIPTKIDVPQYYEQIFNSTE